MQFTSGIRIWAANPLPNGCNRFYPPTNSSAQIVSDFLNIGGASSLRGAACEDF
jgi:hypothetical protein